MHSLSALPHPCAFIEGVGGPELMMILFVVLLLFGGQKLPEFARSFGKAMREFRKAAGNVEDEFKRAIDDVERSASLDTPPAPPVPLDQLHTQAAPQPAATATSAEKGATPSPAPPTTSQG